MGSLYLDWSDALSTGITEVDEDHRHLLALYDRFSRAVGEGAGIAQMEQTLRDLIRYTETHFLREEAAMAEASYPDLDAHRRAHDTIIQQIQDVQNEATSPEDQATRLLAFLGRWLLGHILIVDMRFGEYMKQPDRQRAATGRRRNGRS